MPTDFDVIVVTSSNPNQAELYKQELSTRFPPTATKTTKIISLCDPSGLRIGSGGATLYALLHAYGDDDIGDTTTKSCLILHSGGDSQRNPLFSVTGKGFAQLNGACPMDRLLSQMKSLLPFQGALIAATDTLMTFPSNSLLTGEDQLFSDDCVTGLGILAPWDFGTRHGVFYETEKDGGYSILQKASKDVLFQTKNVLQQGEKVWLDSGVIHLGRNVVASLLAMSKIPPFIAFTSPGMDCGVYGDPPRFELYTDILGSLRGVGENKGEVKDEIAVRVLRNHLNGFSLRVLKCDPQSDFIHVGTTKEHRDICTKQDRHEYSILGLTPRFQAFSSSEGNSLVQAMVTSSDCVLINSMVRGVAESRVSERAVVEHAQLSGYFHIGQGSMVSGCRHWQSVRVSDNMAWQETPIDFQLLQARFPQRELPFTERDDDLFCVSIFGVTDGIKDVHPQGTFANVPWTDCCQLNPTDIWDSSLSQRSLWTARLFPVLSPARDAKMELVSWLQTPNQFASDLTLYNQWRTSLRVSLSDLAWIANVQQIFSYRHHVLPLNIFSASIFHCLVTQSPFPLLPSLPAQFHAYRPLLHAIDDMASTHLTDNQCARMFSLVGDLLAGDRQPRSGDSNHRDFSRILLPGNATKTIIKALAQIRDSPYWSESLLNMSRVARHYDAASQFLTGRCLDEKNDFLPRPQDHFPVRKDVDSSSNQSHKRKYSEDDGAGQWIHATAPARIDLSGGWSDTPPITYESKGGGAVCNVAITLEQDQQHPIGASCRKLAQKMFVLRLGKPQDPSSINTTCQSVEDFNDHTNPKAPAALTKCVLLALVPSAEDLFSSFDYGLELCVYSLLPPGSGLGGSSIIAACGIACASHCLGMALSKQDIVRCVLKVEQLLSTGGGWQDQIGAIFPAFKIGTSKDQLPVKVEVEQLAIPEACLRMFENRVILVQTSPARLARDLLQNVIRRWHRRSPEFTDAIENLRANSKRMRVAILNGNFTEICNEISQFWELKKLVAGAEQAQPKFVDDLFKVLEPHMCGRSLCGAGGGGFAVICLKEGVEYSQVRMVILDNFPEMKVYPTFICHRGLTCYSEDGTKFI